MTPQLSVLAACALLTMRHFCAAVRNTADDKEGDLVVEKNITGGEGELHDEGHSVRLMRKDSYLSVELVEGGDKGVGEGTKAMAMIMRRALELFPDEDGPLVRLKSAQGSDLFWTFMGMAPDEGILQQYDEPLCLALARRFEQNGLLKKIMSTSFKLEYDTVTDALEEGGLDEHPLAVPDPGSDVTTTSEKLLLAAFWYVVKIGGPYGWAQEPKVTLPSQEQLINDLKSYIAGFRTTQRGASLAVVIASLGSYNYVMHDFVPQVFRTLGEKIDRAKSGRPGNKEVRLSTGLNFHLSDEGRKRWTEAFQAAGQEIVPNPAGEPEERRATEFFAEDRDGEVAGRFEPFRDLRHLWPWMTAQQQARAQELAQQLAPGPTMAAAARL